MSPARVHSSASEVQPCVEHQLHGGKMRGVSRLPSSLLEDDFVGYPHDRGGRQPRNAAKRGCAKRGYAKGIRPRVRSRCRPQSDDDSSPVEDENQSGHRWLENLSSYTHGRMELKDGVDLVCAF